MKKKGETRRLKREWGFPLQLKAWAFPMNINLGLSPERWSVSLWLHAEAHEKGTLYPKWGGGVSSTVWFEPTKLDSACCTFPVKPTQKRQKLGTVRKDTARGGRACVGACACVLYRIPFWCGFKRKPKGNHPLWEFHISTQSPFRCVR